MNDSIDLKMDAKNLAQDVSATYAQRPLKIVWRVPSYFEGLLIQGNKHQLWDQPTTSMSQTKQNTV